MFRRKQAPPRQRPTQRINYPDGMMVGTEKATYYIKGGKRYRAYNDRVVASWAIPVAFGSEASVAHIPKSRYPLGYRDAALVENMADGRLYLISSNKRRHITNPDVLVTLDIDISRVVVVSQAEIDLHDQGDDLA